MTRSEMIVWGAFYVAMAGLAVVHSVAVRRERRERAEHGASKAP